MNHSRNLVAVVLAIGLSGCGLGGGDDDFGADSVVGYSTSDPVKNVNRSVFKDNAQADWLKRIKKVKAGSFNGIKVQTDLTMDKANQYAAVKVCEAYTKAMQTPGRVEVFGIVPDIQIDGSDSGGEAKLAGNLPGGFLSDVKASETCIRDSRKPILEVAKPFPANVPQGTMPDFLGVGLEAADDAMTSRGYETYDGLKLVDVTGAGRNPLDLNDWVIVRQEPVAGTDIRQVKTLTLFVKQLSE